MSGERLGTVVQVAGLGCVVKAGFLVAAPLGWVALGAGLLPVGHALDGATIDLSKLRAKMRRPRLKRVA